MGRYISARLNLPIPHLSEALLAAVLADDLFGVTAVGGMTIASDGRRDWFLGGYALEPFIAHYLRGYEIGPPREIETCPQAPGAEYRARLAAAMRARSFRDALSDWERAEPAVETTFVDAPRTTLDDFAPLGPWLVAHADATTSVLGTVALAVERGGDRPGALPWERAYRDIWPPEDAELMKIVGAPLLKLGVDPDPFSPGGSTLMVFTESQVWLRGSGALGGRIGDAEADENLRRLAAFTGRLADASRATSVALSIQGSAFRREDARLRAAFASALGARLQPAEPT